MKFKVGCVEYPETFEIKETDLEYEKIITGFKCPKCGGYAGIVEVDVFKCQDCGLVWSREYDLEDFKRKEE